MNYKKSMRIFWFSLCLLLISGAMIIAVVQYRSGILKKNQDAAKMDRADHETDTGTDSGRLAGSGPDSVSSDRSDSSRILENREYASQGSQTAQPDTVPAGQTVPAYRFELRIEDGCLDVYYYHTQQLYFHTGISSQKLSASQKQDVQNGKYFQSEQDLYGYLESCTS